MVRDPVKGKYYRLYAGIGDRFIPCEAIFTNFKDRLGESLYNRIFHTLVQVAELLGFLSFKILGMTLGRTLGRSNNDPPRLYSRLK